MRLCLVKRFVSDDSDCGSDQNAAKAIEQTRQQEKLREKRRGRCSAKEQDLHKRKHKSVCAWSALCQAIVISARQRRFFRCISSPNASLLCIASSDDLLPTYLSSNASEEMHLPQRIASSSDHLLHRFFRCISSKPKGAKPQRADQGLACIFRQLVLPSPGCPLWPPTVCDSWEMLSDIVFKM